MLFFEITSVVSVLYMSISGSQKRLNTKSETSDVRSHTLDFNIYSIQEQLYLRNRFKTK